MNANRSARSHFARAMLAGAVLAGLYAATALFSTPARGAELQLVWEPSEPGATAQQASVVLAANGAAVSGIQLDLLYDPDRVTVSVAAAPALEWQRKELSVFEPERGVIRILVIGNDAIPLADDAVASVSVSLNPEAEPPGNAAVRASAPVAATPEGDPAEIVIPDTP